MIQPFSIARLPRIVFGRGSFSKVADIAAEYGSRILLVTGAHSLENTPLWIGLLQDLAHRDIAWERYQVAGEPSPAPVHASARA